MTSPSSPATLRIFLSYSSEEASVAEQLYLRFKTSGHHVFFDRTTLTPGDEFDQAIRESIRESDLFVFLISPASIDDGAYARTELRFARDAWPSPVGHVLPVLAATTDFSKIPNYLKAVTILRPEGNLPAEVSAAVDDLATGRKPSDTVAGKLDDVSRIIEQERRDRAVAEIDRDWEEEKKSYAIVVNGQLRPFIPSRSLALVPLLVCWGMALFGYSGFTRDSPEPFGWGPILLPAALGVVLAAAVLARVARYRKAEKRYFARRDDAADGQSNTRRGFLSDILQ